MGREIVAMILAGGRGTRLEALTAKVAKPAVHFGGKYRIIDFPLSNCANSGIDVAMPAKFPVVFVFKSNIFVNFLKLFAKIYLEIKTINIEKIINFKNSIIITFPFLYILYFNFPHFIAIY